jgi:hypothetical protein
VPVALVAAAYSRSVPTAVAGWTLNSRTRMGVISEPPPTPVRPTRKPTNRPENAYRGSMWGSAMERTVVGRMGLQTALDADASHDERGISGAS